MCFYFPRPLPLPPLQAGDPHAQEAKRQRQVEVWLADQLRSGDAAESNANFMVGSHWLLHCSCGVGEAGEGGRISFGASAL